MRLGWHELPASIRTAIEVCSGVVRGVEAIEHGINATFAGTLHTDAGLVFCKGARNDGGMLRREARINPCLPPCAPRLRWTLQAEDWTFAAFDHVKGRKVNFAPGSPDLRRLRELFGEPWPAPPILTRRLDTRWAGLPGWANVARDYPESLDPWAQRHLTRLLELEAMAPTLVRRSAAHRHVPAQLSGR